MAPSVTVISGAISTIKQAYEGARGLMGLNTLAEVNGKAVELQGVILEAQDSAMKAQVAQTELIEQIRNLEREVDNLRSWEKEKANYVLSEIHPGSFVYRYSVNSNGAQPIHDLCALCFNDGKKSILQAGVKGMVKTSLCHRCSSEITVGVVDQGPPPEIVRVNNGSWGRGRGY